MYITPHIISPVRPTRLFPILTLVVMTNGWRRFKWDDVLAGKFPKITHVPSDYITLNGKINGLTKTELIGKGSHGHHGNKQKTGIS